MIFVTISLQKDAINSILLLWKSRHLEISNYEQLSCAKYEPTKRGYTIQNPK